MRERRGILQEFTDATDYGDRTNIDKIHASPMLSGPEDNLVLPESAWLEPTSNELKLGPKASVETAVRSKNHCCIALRNAQADT